VFQFVDPAHLAQVAAGARKPWEIAPSESYPLPASIKLGNSCEMTGLVFDPSTSRLYCMACMADADKRGLIHVWSVR
jgi:hypothetical protein